MTNSNSSPRSTRSSRKCCARAENARLVPRNDVVSTVSTVCTTEVIVDDAESEESHKSEIVDATNHLKELNKVSTDTPKPDCVTTVGSKQNDDSGKNFVSIDTKSKPALMEAADGFSFVANKRQRLYNNNNLEDARIPIWEDEEDCLLPVRNGFYGKSLRMDPRNSAIVDPILGDVETECIDDDNEDWRINNADDGTFNVINQELISEQQNKATTIHNALHATSCSASSLPSSQLPLPLSKEGENEGAEFFLGPPWTEEEHRAFVRAIHEIGLKHASPSVILEKMVFANESAASSHQPIRKKKDDQMPQLTSERVKSHLQKYRNNKTKSTVEFIAEYDSWMQKALAVGAATASTSNNAAVAATAASSLLLLSTKTLSETSLTKTPTTTKRLSRLVPPREIVEIVGCSSSGLGDNQHVLLGGDMAAFLTYCDMWEEDGADASQAYENHQRLHQRHLSQPFQNSTASHAPTAGNDDKELEEEQLIAKYFTGTKVPFPSLTKEERISPLGASIGHVISLFHTMTQNLLKQRSEKQSTKHLDTQRQQPKVDHNEHQQYMLTKERALPHRTRPRTAVGPHNFHVAGEEVSNHAVNGIGNANKNMDFVNHFGHSAQFDTFHPVSNSQQQSAFNTQNNGEELNIQQTLGSSRTGFLHQQAQQPYFRYKQNSSYPLQHLPVNLSTNFEKLSHKTQQQYFDESLSRQQSSFNGAPVMATFSHIPSKSNILNSVNILQGPSALDYSMNMNDDVEDN